MSGIFDVGVLIFISSSIRSLTQISAYNTADIVDDTVLNHVNCIEKIQMKYSSFYCQISAMFS